jgi:hypothetical protein
MTKEIRLNAFDTNCVGHIQHGMWTHPRDRSTEYNTIRYWQDLARLAERGKFDGIFVADIVGVYDVYRGGPAPSIVDAVQIPVNDPMMVVCDGGGHRTYRFRRHRQPDLRTALSVRPSHVDVGPPDRRPGRLEHRDRLSRQRGTGGRSYPLFGSGSAGLVRGTDGSNPFSSSGESGERRGASQRRVMICADRGVTRRYGRSPRAAVAAG